MFNGFVVSFDSSMSLCLALSFPHPYCGDSTDIYYGKDPHIYCISDYGKQWHDHGEDRDPTFGESKNGFSQRSTRGIEKSTEGDEDWVGPCTKPAQTLLAQISN